MVWLTLAVAIDVVHATVMVVWVAALPFLFTRRLPRLRKFCIIYSIIFIIISQVSDLLLGECFLTTLSRLSLRMGGVTHPPTDWFTVRMAEAIFRLRPSEPLIIWLTKALVFLYCIGILYNLRPWGFFRKPSLKTDHV